METSGEALILPVQAFISYSHADDELLDRLRKHLSQLERDGTFSGWFDRDIHAGGKLDQEIEDRLRSSGVFLACVSPDYIASGYCYEKELAFALKREAEDELIIVPVILQPCEWLETPLARFKAVPKDGKSVAEHTNPNVAFLEVATEIRRLCRADGKVVEYKSAAPISSADGTSAHSRYRVQRQFDDLDRRDFTERAYREIFQFFEASVRELESVPEVEARLFRTDEAHFSCTIINRGISRGFETLHVRRGGSWGAIDILYGEDNRANTSNGGFSISSDQYELFLTAGMFQMSGRDDKLSPKDAAQKLWDDLLARVGIDYA
ncbi:toll/interleukin-1 receptor domain-containing protein [Citromicrobium bathyomarinum]|uniref:toll/interleukin-1 receptor domain-containing protein n=1 Tax=Citromicrobium bathyomarinum TaxID=72174 RepID=UPI00315B28AC